MNIKFKPGICHFHQFFSYFITSRFTCTGGEAQILRTNNGNRNMQNNYTKFINVINEVNKINLGCLVSDTCKQKIVT